MVFTNPGRQFSTYALGSDIGKFIAYYGIGNGSGTALATNSVLVNEVNRISITGSPDFSETQKVSFQGDFNAVQMSGITMTEFGLTDTGSSTGFTGSMWSRDAFGSIVFDGTNELQIVTVLEVL